MQDRSIMLREFESRFCFFRIGDIMPVLRYVEICQEFSEFAIIPKKIGENKGESL